jgi:hypothetical protein
MEGCIGKLDRYNDRKIWWKLSLNETVETHVINLFISRLPQLKYLSPNKPLCIESAMRYKHHMHVMMEHCYTGKEIETIPFIIKFNR